MRHFDNIVSALVISGAACFAAMGCAAPSADDADESTGDARQAQVAGAGVDVNAPVGGDISKKSPPIGQAGPELAPVSQAQLSQMAPPLNQAGPELAPVSQAPVTQAPSQELAPVTQAPSQGEFSKKTPEVQNQGEFSKKTPEAPIQGEFSKKLPSVGQGGGTY